MAMHLIGGQPVFRDIRTIAPDGTPREVYPQVILGPALVDNGRYERDNGGGRLVFDKDSWTQSIWQRFYLSQGSELPSLPTLVAVFMQIREALYSRDKELQSIAEELRDGLRSDYERGSLPTSTRFNFVENTLTHRVVTPHAYEFLFGVPLRLKSYDIGGLYKIKELMERTVYKDALTALFGQRDINIVYKALTEIINDEPFLVIHNPHISEEMESSYWAYTLGEVRVDNAWVVRKLHRDARGVNLNGNRTGSRRTVRLDELVLTT